MNECHIRHATAADLPAVVAIYNASIPGQMATADVEPVTVAQREDWFRTFDPKIRPLWIYEDAGVTAGWLGLRSFYGRPAYHRTVESAVYVAPLHQRRGIARALLDHALASAPALGIANVLGFVFAHVGDAEHRAVRGAGVWPLGPAAAGVRDRRGRTRPPHPGAAPLRSCAAKIMRIHA